MRRFGDRWTALVAAALAVRLGTVLLVALTQVVPHNGWYWANKDQVEYYGVARELVHGALGSTFAFIGYGVLLAPFAAGTEFVLQAVPRVAIVQTLLAIPFAYLLYRAGERLAGRRAASIATALWLTFPLWLSTIWFHRYSPPFNLATFWLGMQISVDYAAELLAIGVLYVGAGAIRDGRVGRGVVLGVLSGAAVLMKPSNAVLLASAVVALAVWRHYRAAVAAAVTGVVLTVPQLVTNWRLNGNPLHSEYTSVWPYGDKPIASLAYVPRSIGKLLLLNYTGPLLVLAATAALVVAWRRAPAMRWLVVGQVVAYVLVFAPLYYSISEFMVRFMTPALPALCLAAGAALGGVSGERVNERAVGRIGLAVAGVAVAGAVALSVFAGVAPLRPVVPVLSSLETSAALVGNGRVELTWREPDAPAKLYYEVTRRAEDGSERLIWGGLGNRMTDRPGPGAWTYRVDVVPGFHPSGIPPARVFATSRPVRIDVPA